MDREAQQTCPPVGFDVETQEDAAGAGVGLERDSGGGIGDSHLAPIGVCWWGVDQPSSAERQPRARKAMGRMPRVAAVNSFVAVVDSANRRLMPRLTADSISARFRGWSCSCAAGDD